MCAVHTKEACPQLPGRCRVRDIHTSFGMAMARLGLWSVISGGGGWGQHWEGCRVPSASLSKAHVSWVGDSLSFPAFQYPLALNVGRARLAASLGRNSRIRDGLYWRGGCCLVVWHQDQAGRPQTGLVNHVGFHRSFLSPDSERASPGSSGQAGGRRLSVWLLPLCAAGGRETRPRLRLEHQAGPLSKRAEETGAPAGVTALRQAGSVVTAPACV